jgi:beta-glucosidase
MVVQRSCSRLVLGLLSLSMLTTSVEAQNALPPRASDLPWMNSNLSPDRRADLVISRMTLDEKLQLVHGIGWGVLKQDSFVPPEDNGGAGFVPGIKRLGIPDVNLADSAVGVRMAALHGRYSTLLPSTLGAAASWDTASAFLYGDVIGRELRAQGYNMSIGGGVNLTREPRNGRNFEYAGEDPLLAGTMTGNLMKGVQSNKVMGDIKHYAVNDQETGRSIMNAVVSEKALRESDLLAFQIALSIAHPAAVMCSYNKINGDYACENDYTLNKVLKGDFGFQGWVLSDWEGTHSTVKAALNGLDQEQPGSDYFGEALKKALSSGAVPMSRLNDMVHRVLRSMFACGVIDTPASHSVLDPFRGRDDAQHIEEESIVLLRNEHEILPLKADVRSIAVIGSHADVGVLSGGGSAQVDAPGGNAADPHHGSSGWGDAVYFPSSPLKEIERKAKAAHVTYADGGDLAAAVESARHAEVAIVFVNQFMMEGRDAASLALPDHQDALVAAITAANPRTIVVLETGGPVLMPWRDSVAGILEAWYPGIGGAQALAAILFGEVNPSGKLPVTFAASDADLPHPEVPGLATLPQPKLDAEGMVIGEPPQQKPFDVDYTEGSRIGYKWFESEHKVPLFPFGFGLSYTKFVYSGLTINSARKTATFQVENAGNRAGAEIAEVYAELPPSAGEHFKRLVGWKRVDLEPKQRVNVTVEMDARALSLYDEAKRQLELPEGTYTVLVGASSRDTPLKKSTVLR